MTARQLFEASLIELAKEGAPSMLLSDYNYYINKSINLYINKSYNVYDLNQVTTDSLRVLKSTAVLDAYKSNQYDGLKIGNNKAHFSNGIYEVNLPDDYLHLLNCICIYELQKTHGCYDKGEYAYFPAKRLTADSWSSVIVNYFLRPKPDRPYYYIHNVNTSTELPTNPILTVTYKDGNSKDVNVETGTDMVGRYSVTPGINKEDEGNITTDPNILAGQPERVEEDQKSGTNFNRVIKIGKDPDAIDVSTIEREAAQRYGNPSKVRCEIRYGSDDTIYKLRKVAIDYVKTPLHIRLTQEQVDLTEDTSQILEFPDSVCQEIINELVLLILEHSGDPRLLTHSQVTQSIANPVQQLNQTLPRG